MHEFESGKLLGTATVLRDALSGISRSDIVIRSGVPTVEDYCRLRALCGMGPRSDAGAAVGLPNSWYGVQALDDDRPVGMGRIIGDGESHRLYRQFGFINTAPSSIGMHRVTL